jgi:hypothetical protein
MALIAVCTDDPGVARIFFDLRPAEPSKEEERRIASAIERASTKETTTSGTGSLRRASIS